MKHILAWFFILSLSLAAAHAQEDATQQQINELNGRLQNMQESLDAQGKRIAALEQEINDLHDKSGATGAAAADQGDLQKLAEQVQDLAKKQKADQELILKEIEKLGKVGGGSTSSHKSTPAVSTTVTDNPAAATSGPQKGYDYTIQKGDTVLAIAKAYREQGIKVTTDQILKANPGLDPKSLIVGKKIFIPAPGQ